MKLVNLTPHEINIVREDGSKILDVPTSGIVARADERRTSVDIAGLDISVSEITYGAVEMPEPEPGVIYIVSALAAQQLPNRQDILIPGPLKREKGQPIGCVGLSRYAPPQ